MTDHSLFRSSPFHFEALRTLAYAGMGAATIQEVLGLVPRIRNGDFESWYREWSHLAATLAQRASTLADPVSAGHAWLRASNYQRTAEFYLDPADPRRPDSYRMAQETFYRALELLGVEFTRSRIPFEDAEMETLYLRAPGERKEEVLVVHGGFDSTPEELYLMIGAAATERGYDVLIYEGPGQGNLLRRHGVPMRPDWEQPASVALDSLAAHGHPKRIIGVGISLGGHLLARAAAFLDRYDAIVLLDYFPSPLDAFLSKLPAALHARIRSRPPGWLDPLVRLAARFDPELRWQLAQGRWVFGCGELKSLLEYLRDFDEDAWVKQIRAHALVLLGEEEHFFSKQLAHRFVDRLGNARSAELREFGKHEAGHLHCRNGAFEIAHERIFDWIAALPEAEDQ